MAVCSALETGAPTAPPARHCRWSITLGSVRSSHGGLRGQGSSQAPGRVKQRELKLLLAAAAAVAASGAQEAEILETSDPKVLPSLTATAHSMLLSRSCSASTLLGLAHGATGAPVGIFKGHVGGVQRTNWEALRLSQVKLLLPKFHCG